MGWKECNKMDEKLKFIAKYLEGERASNPIEYFLYFGNESSLMSARFIIIL